MLQALANLFKNPVETIKAGSQSPLAAVCFLLAIGSLMLAAALR